MRCYPAASWLTQSSRLLEGFDSGAKDDYLAKPFEMRELMARVNALLSRSQLADSI